MKNSKQMFETFFKGIKNKFDVLIVHKDHPFSPNGIHSGAEMGTIHLARALVRVGYQVMVVGKITSGPGVYDDVFYYDLGETYNVQECFDDLKEYEIDLLISVTRADVIKLSLKYGNINKRAMWLQDSALEETRGTVEQINQTSDLIIYVSQVLRKHLESQGIDESLGTIIHNGFDNSIFYPRKNPFNKNKIIFAGALVPEKGINLLVDAFNIACQLNPI